MKALIVGLGSIGRRHLTNLRQLVAGVTVIALRHRRPSSSLDDGPSSERASQPDHEVYSLDEAVACRPDLALIASPSPMHFPQAMALAEAGVPLFIEKPLADRSEGVDRLTALCRQQSLPLLVGYSLRHYRPLQAMHDAIRSGRIGRPLALRAEVGQYLPDWRPTQDYRQTVTARSDLGGGVLLELSHELDYARWMLGEVAAIDAHTARVSDLEIDVEDVADIVLQFDSGAVGNIHLDMLDRSATRRCRIVGTEGTLTWDLDGHRVRCYSAETRQWADVFAVKDFDCNEMYLNQLRHFLDCVAGRATPAVTGEDGLRTLQLVEAARRSSRQRRTTPLPAFGMAQETPALAEVASR